ncbi:MAG: type I secretion system permease/ATPase [Verrucomicrobiota bacterium]
MNVPPSDTLLEALEFFGKVHARPINRQGVLQGLPIADGVLTPDLFARAAARSGFETKMIRRPLRKLSNATMPMVLLLKNNEACIVQSVASDQADVVVLTSGASRQMVSRKQLEQAYSGIAILVKPTFRFEKRSDFNPKTLGNNWFWGTLWKFRSFYSRVALASLVTNFLALASSLFVMNVYDRVVPNQALDTLIVLAIGVIVAYVFEFMLKTVRAFFVDRAGQRIDMILGSEIFGRILGMRYGDRPVSAGTMANQARSYETLRDFFTSATVAALVDLPFIFLFVGVIFLLGGPMVCIPLVAGVALALLIGVIMQIPISRAVGDSYQASNQRQALVVEGIQALETIKSTRSESQLQARMEEAVKVASRSEIKSRAYSQLAMNSTAFITHLVSTGIVIFAFFEVVNENLTMGAMIACVILTGRAMAPMAMVASLLTRLQQSRRSLAGLNQIMDMQMERDDATASYISVAEFEPSIHAHDLKFSYDPESDPVINGINVRIEPGERVALLGRIGSGKSSLLRLLNGLYNPTDGRIDVSGIDVRQLDPAELRSHIGYVQQDATLLYGTLRSNLTAGCPWIDDPSILEALRIAGLADFIRTLPRGIDHVVSEGGRSLSGGQRQALAVARAVIEEPDLLIFDEPTSSMDTATERRMLASLNEYLKTEEKRTLVVATHKRSVLSIVDRVIVMDTGRIIADGPRDKIMKSKVGSEAQRQAEAAAAVAAEAAALKREPITATNAAPAATAPLARPPGEPQAAALSS